MQRAIPRAPLLALFTAVLVLIAAAPPPERGRRGGVAADHPLASRAGAEVLAAGGNAVDAAIAAALASGVVQPAGSGLGGGGFALVVGPGGGDPLVLDFREVAPGAAHRDLFADRAPDASRLGGLAVAVPGEPRGLVRLHREQGRLPLAAVARPAQRLAKEGFTAGAHLTAALDALGSAAGPLSQGLFAAPPPRRGEPVRRARLASALEALVRTGGEAFYTGPVAEDLLAATQATGGVLTAADLAGYAPRPRGALTGAYRGWTVLAMPPPSSGGVVLLQALQVLEALPPAQHPHNSAEHLHLLTEVMKHGFADRARHLGDPDRVKVPVERLLSRARVEEVRRAIVPSRTQEPAAYGAPVDPGRDAGTLHISAVDAEGRAVALTTTINTSFGSRVVSGRYGILLNNEMDDFVARPGQPNAFGLIGSESNAVAAGARPLSSMSPTVLISPDGQTRLVVGASGGPQIISGTLQAIVNIIDFGMDPAAAVSAPRVHHQWQPDVLVVEPGVSADTVALLRARGHTVQVQPHYSSVQAALWSGGPSPEAACASDPRKGGVPAAID